MPDRRGHGEGSVHQRASDGRWVGAGARSSTARNRPTSSANCEASSDRSTTGCQRRTTASPLGRWSTAGIVTCCGHQVAPTAFENYRTIAERHIRPALGRKRVAKLTPADVDALISSKLDAGLSVSTVRRIRAVLCQALAEAERWGLVARNVAAIDARAAGSAAGRSHVHAGTGVGAACRTRRAPAGGALRDHARARPAAGRGARTAMGGPRPRSRCAPRAASAEAGERRARARRGEDGSQQEGVSRVSSQPMSDGPARDAPNSLRDQGCSSGAGDPHRTTSLECNSTFASRARAGHLRKPPPSPGCAGRA